MLVSRQAGNNRPFGNETPLSQRRQPKESRPRSRGFEFRRGFKFCGRLCSRFCKRPLRLVVWVLILARIFFRLKGPQEFNVVHRLCCLDCPLDNEVTIPVEW